MMGRYLEGGAGSSATGNGTYPMMRGGGIMGYGYANQSASRSSGWPAGAVIAIAGFGALLLAGGLAVALPKLRKRGGGGHAATPATRQT